MAAPQVPQAHRPVPTAGGQKEALTRAPIPAVRGGRQRGYRLHREGVAPELKRGDIAATLGVPHTQAVVARGRREAPRPNPAHIEDGILVGHPLVANGVRAPIPVAPALPGRGERARVHERCVPLLVDDRQEWHAGASGLPRPTTTTSARDHAP